MKKHLNLTALLLVLVFAGCQKDIQKEQIAEGAATQQKAATDATATRAIYLQVEVMQGGDYKITPDKNAPYIHGQDRVQAVIWGDSGDFFMNTNNNASRDAIRWIKFIGDGLPLNRLNGVRNYRMRTQKVGDDPASMLHNMQNNETRELGFFIWGEKPAGVFDWKLRFQYHLDPQPLPTGAVTTSFVLVTKKSSNPNVWELEPISPATGYLKDGTNELTQITNYYQVPFKLKLTERMR